MKHPANIDIAVLIVFFNRPGHLKRVFEEVRKARPSRLFLYQDGPRGDRDIAAMEECRRIVDNVDWECEVFRKYNERNSGSDPSGYNAHTWAFSIADKCIVLEDDCLPVPSFFRFCKEMLDRYENDERIAMVAGFNSEETNEGVEADYFFTTVFSTWGWASWSRVVGKWDTAYAYFDNPAALREVEAVMKQRRYCPNTFRACERNRRTGINHFETIFWSAMVTASQLAIMPTRNMISNLGGEGESSHYDGSIATMPRRMRRLFTMGRYDVTFPLHHPEYVIEDADFKDRVFRTYAYGHPLIKAGRSLEELALNLRYGNFGFIAKSVRNRLHKLTGR